MRHLPKAADEKPVPKTPPAAPGSQWSKQAADMAKDYRSYLGSRVSGLNHANRTDILRGGKNIAISDLEIAGKTIRVPAFSGPANAAGFAPFVPNESRVLQVGGAGKFLRDLDAEAKILEKVLSMTTPETTGTLRVFSEIPVCPACQETFSNFAKYRPGLRIEVFDGRGGSFEINAKAGQAGKAAGAAKAAESAKATEEAAKAAEEASRLSRLMGRGKAIMRRAGRILGIAGKVALPAGLTWEAIDRFTMELNQREALKAITETLIDVEAQSQAIRKQLDQPDKLTMEDVDQLRAGIEEMQKLLLIFKRRIEAMDAAAPSSAIEVKGTWNRAGSVYNELQKHDTDLLLAKLALRKRKMIEDELNRRP
jgi:hypothetical protein